MQLATFTRGIRTISSRSEKGGVRVACHQVIAEEGEGPQSLPKAPAGSRRGIVLYGEAGNARKRAYRALLSGVTRR